MTPRKRTSVEDVMEKVLSSLEEETPVTVGALADVLGTSWEVVDRAVGLLLEFQDFFAAYVVEVLGGRGKKVVVLGLRVDLTKLSDGVREWFIEEKFFKGEEKGQFTTEQAREVLGIEIGSGGRTALEESMRRVTETLLLEDELSVLELSKRADINRRTVERVLDVIDRIQDQLAEYRLVRHETGIIYSKRPVLYDLDKTRMKLLLKKRYMPDKLTDKEHKSILRLSHL